MASVSVATAGIPGTADQLFACVAGEGTAAHPYVAGDALTESPDAPRNLADMVHLLCALHGRHPGIVDHAAGRAVEPEARHWFAVAGPAMGIERAYLANLAVAAGPIPGTPGGAGNEAMLVAQRSALGVLAQSDRRGCALGAALAFVADWLAVRRLLDAAAHRFGVEVAPWSLRDEADLAEVAEAAGADPLAQRAIIFGARQLALQQRGLWDLLEARAQARTDA